MTDVAKIKKKLPAGYADDLEGYDAARLRAEVFQSEVNIQAVESERKHDEKLAGAKEIVKDLTGPYREAVAAQRAKIAYALHLLEARGELPAAD